MKKYKENLKNLNRLYVNKENTLILMYGNNKENRKKLITNFIKDKNDIVVTIQGLKGYSIQSQKKHFKKSIKEVFKKEYNLDKNFPKLKNHWNSIFHYLSSSINDLAEEIDNPKIILNLENCDWFGVSEEQTKSFKNSFGYFFNTCTPRRNKFELYVLFHSNEYKWLEKQVLRDVGSLYLRHSEVLQLT